MIAPLFVCHGGPTLAIENNEYTRFLRDLGKNIKPKAIVVFTAHWESQITKISYRDDTYDMIYDFSGFPEELYKINYPAKGSTEVAYKIQKLLHNSNISSEFDYKRGLDHGAWVMLNIMYPGAEIPVVQVSVNLNMKMEEQYKLGEALRGLAEEDILVLGSGATVHNLAVLNWNAKETEEWALGFDNWLIARLERKAKDELFSYRQVAPYAKRAVPREEHLVPLFIAMGAGLEVNTPKVLHQSYEFGNLSYIAISF